MRNLMLISEVGVGWGGAQNQCSGGKEWHHQVSHVRLLYYEPKMPKMASRSLVAGLYCEPASIPSPYRTMRERCGGGDTDSSSHPLDLSPHCSQWVRFRRSKEEVSEGKGVRMIAQPAKIRTIRPDTSSAPMISVDCVDR